MEERLIDDEYGKGVRMKKTKDGYVLADEYVSEGVELENEAQEEEEIAFEFPTFEAGEGEDDLIGLDPEELQKRLAERERIEAEKRAEYEKLCEAGNALLAKQDFENAEKEFEKASLILEEHTEASLGFWRAKTQGFASAKALVEEYEEAGVENLAYDLGEDAVAILKAEQRELFQKEYDALLEDEAPLKEKFESKQESRREYLKKRLKKSSIIFGISAIPFIAFVVLTAVYIRLIFQTQYGENIPFAVAFGVLAVVFFILFVIAGNRFSISLRLHLKNERTDSTDDGARLVQISLQKEVYEFFLKQEEKEEETA